jgi:FHA domain-containing protein
MMPARRRRRIAMMVVAIVLGGTVAIAATPSAAHAQLGFLKKLVGKGKKKPAAPPAGAPQAPGQPGAPAADPAQGGTTPGAPAAAPMTAQRQAEKDTLLAYGRRLDTATPQTMATAKERLDFWEGLKLSGNIDPEIFQRYQQALRDYDQLKGQDSTRRASDSSANAVNARIERATRALQARNLDAAQSSVDEILAANPDNQRALLLRDQILDLQRAKRFKMVLFAMGGALLLIAVGAAAFARKIFKKDKDDASGAPAAATGSKQKALVKVIDGVGRGKLFAIDGDIFRIGAAASDKPEEKNDVVLSDSAKSISRFHCSIIKRGKDYFLLDSSLNGTDVNGKALARGEHHRLQDGDEFTLATVARLKFLKG